MTPVFISYDSRDRYFVGLLAALLDHESIDSWCDRDRIPAGSPYQKRIEQGLANSQSLITVVSKHAVQSKWVTAELAAFCATRSDPVVIPLLLDGTQPSDVFHTLGAYQSIDMTEDMLKGFVTLCHLFERKFLTGQMTRRSGERRDQGDRRTNLLRRIRTGMWQAYASTTGLGKFDLVEYKRPSQRGKIADALEAEIQRYELLDEHHKQIDSRWALKSALDALGNEQLGENRAIYVIEKLAAHLFEHYEVRNRDRRDKHERRTTAR